METTTVTVKAEDVIRDAMKADLTPLAQRAWLEDAAGCIRRHGVVVIRDAIPRAALAAVLDDFKVRHDVHMAPAQKKLYRRFQSDPLRAQVPVAIDGPVANSEFFAPPSVQAVTRHLMGDDLILGEMGVVISHAGAGAGAGVQEIHRDSDFLFGGLDMEIDLPPFAMTMLVPLLDVTLDMGPTEFWAGSHRRRCGQSSAAHGVDRGIACVDRRAHPASRWYQRIGARPANRIFQFHRRWYVENPGYEEKPQIRVTPAMLQGLPKAYQPLLSWALHLNRTDGFSEFVHRWIGRIRARFLRLKGA